jgi:hypothetical protein
LKRADHAMLLAKRSGKNQVVYFEEGSDEVPLSGRTTLKS